MPARQLAARSFSDLSGSPPLLWPTAGLTFRGLVRHTEPFCHRWARRQDSYLGLHGELPTLPPAPRTHQAVKLPTFFSNINLIHFLIYWRDNFLLLNLIKLKRQANLNSLVCNSPELEDVSLFDQSYLNSSSPRSILLVGAF